MCKIKLTMNKPVIANKIIFWALCDFFPHLSQSHSQSRPSIHHDSTNIAPENINKNGSHSCGIK